VVGAPQPMRPIVSPNPMRHQSIISFATSRPGPLRADIFDGSGRRVRRLAGEAASPAGWHTLAMDGRDDGGSALPTGIYFYRIVSADGHATGRFAIVK
jgi:flagellar hook assembly protein FlgD